MTWNRCANSLGTPREALRRACRGCRRGDSRASFTRRPLPRVVPEQRRVQPPRCRGVCYIYPHAATEASGNGFEETPWGRVGLADRRKQRRSPLLSLSLVRWQEPRTEQECHKGYDERNVGGARSEPFRSAACHGTPPSTDREAKYDEHGSLVNPVTAVHPLVDASFGSEHFVEGTEELGIPVPDQEPDPTRPPPPPGCELAESPMRKSGFLLMPRMCNRRGPELDREQTRVPTREPIAAPLACGKHGQTAGRKGDQSF